MAEAWSEYRKSTRSEGGGACVEVAFGPGGAVRVRDSKLGLGSPVLEFSAGDWRAFVAGLPSAVLVVATPGGGADLSDALDAESPVLSFTPAEWAAFMQGMADGQFTKHRAAQPALV